MDLCPQCGHELGIGRFCTNCGRPVDRSSDPAEDLAAWRTDTAERPRAAAPVEPPPAPERPEPPRFPLYADDEPPAASPPERVAPVVLPPPPPVVDRSARTHRGGPPVWVPWLVGFGLMALVAGFGAWLLFGGSDDPDTAQAPPPATNPTDEEEPAEVEPSSPRPSPTRSADPEPFEGDLARFASVSAPPAAPPGQGADGEVVRYVAANMLDGVPETAWRMPGDGTGRSITFRFDEPATLTEVGLVNGYAKVARDRRGILDWYHGNRRVTAVEWTFDDGTVVTQRLGDTTLIQMTRVAEVRTESVTVRLLRVTSPGGGRTSRNYTAISEASFLGTTP